MPDTLYTVPATADKLMRCCECRGALRAGEDAVSRCSNGWVEHAHIHCPPPVRMQNPELRVVQA